jgi:hypothetical protein
MHHLKKLLLITLFFVSHSSFAQDSSRTVKVAVFVPLYLDTAFNGTSYKLGTKNIPKYILPGLDFYNGVMMAIDSLNKENIPLEVQIYDTKAKDRSISKVLASPDFNDLAFIIASFTTKDELKLVADSALAKNIPLFSATYPNDGGIMGNPNLILVNPTLLTHIEGVYKYVQRNHSLDNVILLNRKGDQMDELIKVNFEDAAKKYGFNKLKIKYVEVDAYNYEGEQVIELLDSTKKNVIIGATLNETFAKNIVRTLSSVKETYGSTAIGMPTWDNMKELNKNNANGVEIVYSTPYNFQRSDSRLTRLATVYRNKFYGRASDMVFKGYEAMNHFTRVYLKYGNAFMTNLSTKDFKFFNDFDFQHVKAKKESPSTDYLENKKLYFVKKLDGAIKSIN